MGSTPSNCTIDSSIDTWVNSYFAINVVISICGTLGGYLAIWNLSRCGHTHRAIKIQLGMYFGVQQAFCLLELIPVSYLTKLDVARRYNEVPKEWRYYAFFLYTSLYALLRLEFAAISICRLVAVRWPFHYKKLVRTRVILMKEAIFLAYSLLPWLFSLGVRNMDYVFTDTTKIGSMKGKQPWYIAIKVYQRGVHLVAPLISFISYSLMLIVMFRHKRQKKTQEGGKQATEDHVTRAIHIILFFDLLPDVPHIVIHYVGSCKMALIFHNFFHLQFAVDPIIFVAINPRYREASVGLFRSCCGWARGRHQEPETVENV